MGFFRPSLPITPKPLTSTRAARHPCCHELLSALLDVLARWLPMVPLGPFTLFMALTYLCGVGRMWNMSMDMSGMRDYLVRERENEGILSFRLFFIIVYVLLLV